MIPFKEFAAACAVSLIFLSSCNLIPWSGDDESPVEAAAPSQPPAPTQGAQELNLPANPSSTTSPNGVAKEHHWIQGVWQSVDYENTQYDLRVTDQIGSAIELSYWDVFIVKEGTPSEESIDCWIKTSADRFQLHERSDEGYRPGPGQVTLELRFLPKFVELIEDPANHSECARVVEALSVEYASGARNDKSIEWISYDENTQKYYHGEISATSHQFEIMKNGSAQ